MANRTELMARPTSRRGVLWIRLTLKDESTIEGTIPNDLLNARPWQGFYVTVLGRRSSKGVPALKGQRIWVAREDIADAEVLSKVR